MGHVGSRKMCPDAVLTRYFAGLRQPLAITCIVIICTSLTLPVSSSLLNMGHFQQARTPTASKQYTSPVANVAAMLRLRGGSEKEYDSKDAEKFDREPCLKKTPLDMQSHARHVTRRKAYIHIRVI
jgi:hypothetical protein